MGHMRPWRSGRDSNPRLTRLCRPPLFRLSYADRTAGLSRQSCVTDFRIAMGFHFCVLLHHTPRLSGVSQKRKRSGPKTGLVHPQGCEPRRRRDRGERNPPRTDVYWSRLRTKPIRATSGWTCLLHGDGYPIPRSIKRGRSSCLRNRGGGTGRIRTGTISGYVLPKLCHLRYCPI